MLRRLMRRLLPGRREDTGSRSAGPIRAEALRSVAAYLGGWAATEDAPLERHDAILTGPPPTGTKLASHIASILINAVDLAAADADLASIPLDIRGSTQDPAASRAVARSLAVAAYDLRASRQAQVVAADLHDGITNATPLLEDIEAYFGLRTFPLARTSTDPADAAARHSAVEHLHAALQMVDEVTTSRIALAVMIGDGEARTASEWCNSAARSAKQDAWRWPDALAGAAPIVNLDPQDHEEALAMLAQIPGVGEQITVAQGRVFAPMLSGLWMLVADLLIGQAERVRGTPESASYAVAGTYIILQYLVSTMRIEGRLADAM